MTLYDMGVGYLALSGIVLTLSWHLSWLSDMILHWSLVLIIWHYLALSWYYLDIGLDYLTLSDKSCWVWGICSRAHPRTRHHWLLKCAKLRLLGFLQRFCHGLFLVYYIGFNGWPAVAGCILWSTIYPGERILAIKSGTKGRTSNPSELLGGNKSIIN